MIATNIIGTVLVMMLGFIFWQIRKQQGNLKAALYKEDGVTIYITRGECEKINNKFEKSVCDKVDEIKNAIKDMDDKREIARKEDFERREKDSKKWQLLQHTLGKIDG